MSSGSSRADKRGRADQVAEHHRQLPPLGLRRGHRRGDGRAGRRRPRPVREAGDRLEQLLARAERQAELLEVGFGQLGQHLPVDLVVAERLLVALQPQTAQPSGDVHGSSLDSAPCFALHSTPNGREAPHTTSRALTGMEQFLPIPPREATPPATTSRPRAVSPRRRRQRAAARTSWGSGGVP